MIELILLAILIFIGILWFRNLSDNSNKEENPDIEKARKHKLAWFIGSTIKSMIDRRNFIASGGTR